MKTLLLVTSLLALSSCAALTRYKCNREYAVRKGMEDASAGLSSMPNRQDGASCEGDYSGPTFSKDYMYGFQQKKQEVCVLTAASAYGRTDGEAGDAAKPQRAKLNLCADLRDYPKMEAAYDKEFTRAFCSPAHASKAGTAMAQTWGEPDFDTVFNDCRANNSALKNSYMSAYKQTIALSCTEGEAMKAGEAQGLAGSPMGDGISHLERCATVGKGNLRSVYERSYNDARRRAEAEAVTRQLQEQERIRQAKMEEFQRNVATTSFTFRLRNYRASCRVADNRSYVQVEIENPFNEQVVIQGDWKVIYYDRDFNKITEDRTTEATLITGYNKKTFQKMTLPVGANYCRAEFLSGGTGLIGPR